MTTPPGRTLVAPAANTRDRSSSAGEWFRPRTMTVSFARPITNSSLARACVASGGTTAMKPKSPVRR